jgi:1,4-dihydroxy-6-naphthoate synthase
MNGVSLTLAHSPDADDAFMWWPLTGKIHPRDRDKRGVAEPITQPILESGRFHFLAVPADIEALNRRAIDAGDLDITALSMHTYPHVKDRYILTACGASMGDGYGPKLVCRRQMLDELGGDGVLNRLRSGELTLAIPGRRTTAFLTLSLMLGTPPARAVEMPFDQVVTSVTDGAADAGLVIHDAQLTFAGAGLVQVADLGAWWRADTGGLPLPLGANAVRRDLDERFGPGASREVASLLEASVRVSLERRAESLEYVAAFAPGTTPEQVDRYINMYVTPLTVHAGERGLHAIRQLLRRGRAAGLCPDPGEIELLAGAG